VLSLNSPARLHAFNSLVFGISLTAFAPCYHSWGWNGKTWTCYKGDKRWIFAPYQPEAVTGCTNIYYCVPA